MQPLAHQPATFFQPVQSEASDIIGKLTVSDLPHMGLYGPMFLISLIRNDCVRLGILWNPFVNMQQVTRQLSIKQVIKKRLWLLIDFPSCGSFWQAIFCIVHMSNLHHAYESHYYPGYGVGACLCGHIHPEI